MKNQLNNILSVTRTNGSKESRGARDPQFDHVFYIVYIVLELFDF
jgi:hypothetical protein